MTSTSYLRPAVGLPEHDPVDGHRRRLVIAAVVAIVVALAVVWVIVFSPVFGVRSVEVNGARATGAGTVSASQVRAAADIADGSPLIRLDTAAIAARVERIPAIATAQVSTSFPSTVTITVTERTAVGYTLDGSRFSLLDRTGAQYRTVATVPAHLPHFVLPPGATARATGAALATVSAALPAPLRAKLITVQALDPDSISLSLRDGVVVQWGSAGDSAEKARVLRALLDKHAVVIDVSDPDQPFTR